MKTDPFDPGNFPLQIRALYLRDAKLRMAPEFDPFIPGQHLNALFRAERMPVQLAERENSRGNKIKLITFVTSFGFRYNAASEPTVRPGPVSSTNGAPDENGLVAEITADIATCYEAALDASTSDSNLEQWASTTVLIHAWPYWREFSHSAMTRMGLPISLMPMMDIQNIVNAAVIKAHAAAEKAAKAPRSRRKTPRPSE